MHSVLLPPGGTPCLVAQRHAPTRTRKAMHSTLMRVAKPVDVFEAQQQPQQQPVSISEISTLQELLERAKTPWRKQQHQTPQPSIGDDTKLQQTRARLHKGSLYINLEPAGRQAARLTSTLRTRQHTDVQFEGVLSVVKCLKVLAITNQFLLGHGTASNFVFAQVSEEDHQARFNKLMQKQLRIQKLSTVTNKKHPIHRIRSWDDQPAKPLHIETGIQQEPVPRLPALLFKLHVWSFKQDQANKGKPRRQIQNLEFAIDLRQEWARHAYVSFDTALAMADNLYGQLISQVEASENAISHTQLPGEQQQQRQQQQHHKQHDDGIEVSHVPRIVCTCSTPQVLPLFAAMSFIQQRLYQDNSPYMLVCSVAPPSQCNRLDGCKGFVISAELQPRSLTKAVLHRMRTYRKSPRRSQPNSPENISTANSQGGDVSSCN